MRKQQRRKNRKEKRRARGKIGRGLETRQAEIRKRFGITGDVVAGDIGCDESCPVCKNGGALIEVSVRGDETVSPYLGDTPRPQVAFLGTDLGALIQQLLVTYPALNNLEFLEASIGGTPRRLDHELRDRDEITLTGGLIDSTPDLP